LALTACLAVVAVLAGTGAAKAGAATTITSFDVTTSSTQAGGHPNWDISFSLESDTDVAQDVTVELPAGFWLERPGAVLGCSNSDFALNQCSSETQVGLVVVRADYGGSPNAVLGTAPLYHLDPAGELNRFGFVIPTVNVPMVVHHSLREASDYGPRLRLPGWSQLVPLSSLSLTIWGVPGAPSHDVDRFPKGSPGDPPGCPGSATAACAEPTAFAAVVNPETLHPSVCGAALSALLMVSTFQDPNTPSTRVHSVPATTGCDQQSFFPTLTVATSKFGFSPSGLDLNFSVPQPNSPSVPTPSPLRSLRVELPVELEINPDGPEFSTCTDPEAGLGTEAPADCPPDSKLGQVSFTGIDPMMTVEVYLGEPGPAGEDRLLILGSSTAVDLKLVATLDTDLQSDGLVLELDLPQLPISFMTLHLHELEDDLFRTPLRCGAYQSTGMFTAWNGSLPPQKLFGVPPTMITDGPRGAPCVGNAQEVQVRLIPLTIPADGRFQSQVEIGVLDANGTAVPAEDVVVTTSDPGQSIGPALDNEDGTYSSTITSSTTPGTVTVTATDHSVTPPLSGSTILTQNGLPTLDPPIGDPGRPMTAPPVARISKRPPRRTRNRRPAFSFTANSPGATFACKLDRSPFRPCFSPFASPRLSPGAHSFAVRARSAAGTGPTATWSFRVLKPRMLKKKR